MVTGIFLAAVLGRAERQAFFELSPLLVVFIRVAYLSTSSSREIVELHIKMSRR